jgi:hypothetical protein
VEENGGWRMENGEEGGKHAFKYEVGARMSRHGSKVRVVTRITASNHVTHSGT